MNTIRRLGVIFMVMMGLAGCQKDTLMPEDGTKDLGSEIELTMSALMSDIVIPTRAITESEETAITRLDVLVFDGSDNFVYTIQANSPTVASGKLTYTVRLKKSTGSEKYKLVLLANLTAAPTITVGTAKETALTAITFVPATNWTTGGTIPMWAEYPTAAAVTIATTASSFGTTAVIRSLARVNVTNTATSTFTLTKVWVYNSTNKARVAPLFTYYDANNKKVTAPSIASGAATTNVYSKTATSNKVEREIYIGESDDKPVGDASAVCLVLEGTFGGKTNYYRVDLVAADGKTPLDILRNYTYNINITKVEGSGYATKEDAFASLPVNITVDIKVWDDANLNDITTDGQYSLAVESSTVDLAVEAGAGTIYFESDYPKTITATSTDNWITGITVGGISPKAVTFNFSQNTSFERTGTITITAGRIQKTISIRQAEPVVYVGMFSGELVGNDTDGWAFSKPLYVQVQDQTEDATTIWVWALSSPEDHSALAGSKTDGRANTWNLNKGASGSLTDFPAANLCFKKNNATHQAGKDALVWYLPAQEQLMGIWVTANGSNASFGSGRYWSSSENANGSSWYLNFSNGYTESYGKDYSYQVRCVRE